MTSSGVERDLTVTPYLVDIKYPDKTMVYCFSSMNSKTLFERKIEEHRAEIKESLTNRFRILFSVSDDFCDLDLYRRIERRGFLVKMEGDNITWLGQVEYNGQRVIRKS